VRALRSQVKVPQIGWNRVRWIQDAAGFRSAAQDDFYFVHSYIIEPDDLADVVAVTRYGEVFPSIVRHGHVWGTQFHPEKSGPAGLRLVAGWVDGAALIARGKLLSVPA